MSCVNPNQFLFTITTNNPVIQNVIKCLLMENYHKERHKVIIKTLCTDWKRLSKP